MRLWRHLGKESDGSSLERIHYPILSYRSNLKRGICRLVSFKRVASLNGTSIRCWNSSGNKSLRSAERNICLSCASRCKMMELPSCTRIFTTIDLQQLYIATLPVAIFTAKGKKKEELAKKFLPFNPMDCHAWFNLPRWVEHNIEGEKRREEPCPWNFQKKKFPVDEESRVESIHF